MATRIQTKVPLVSRDLPRGRLLSHLANFDGQGDREQQQGRFARHDRVAMCLLRRDMDSIMPVRREVRIARNRRRLKVTAFLFLLWWLIGRFLIV
jgi:hypothetical protein